MRTSLTPHHFPGRISAPASVRTASKALLALSAVLAALSFLSCSPKPADFARSGLEGVEEVSPGKIGAADPVVIRFKDPVASGELLSRALRFRPEIKGSWALQDDRTAVFTPEAHRKALSDFTLEADTGLLAGGSAGQEGCVFNFTVSPVSVSLSDEGLYTSEDDPLLFTLSGTLRAGLPVSQKEAAAAVKATLAGSGALPSLETLWEPSGEARGTSPVSRDWRFTVRGIRKGSEERKLTLAWEGGALGSRDKGSKDWIIPAADDFRVLDITAADSGKVQVRFSEPLDKTQDLRGLVTAGSPLLTGTAQNVRYSLDSNLVTLYGTDGFAAGGDVAVREGIRSASGKVLALPAAASISTPWDIPEARFPDGGVILPTTQGVVVPVETKNLRGLIVEAYQIYGDNMLQFLQNNELDGKYELRRVGEPVWSDVFEFPWDDSMKNRSVTRGLDLSELVKKHPGGMIQLRITFRSRHVMYQCQANHGDFSRLPMPDDAIPVDRISDENSYWDYWGDMDWKDRQTYWTYRNDPCHPAFYLYDYHNAIVARKNVLVSDLALMAKKDASGGYRITVADIGSTAPVPGVKVSLYSYAQRMIASETTGSDGTVAISPGSEPSFITASKGGQSTYLRIDAGAALSVSHFKVDGVRAEKGVKGFIYAERGVWRPGDDIHLVFLLQDLAKRLPAKYPVTFELEDPLGRVAKTGTYTDSLDGFYRIDTATETGDPTGKWIARVKAGGQSWTKTLRIESIIPNRIAIGLKTEDGALKASDNRFTLTGEWLHGAPTPGFKADMKAFFLNSATAFDGYADYVFTNPERSVESEEETVWEGTLGSDSAARFDVDLYAGDSLPGKLTARLTTRIFEPSGLFSVEQSNYEYSPYDRYVGIKLPKGDAARGMLLTDQKHNVDLALLDSSGKPVQGSVKLDMTVYKLEWKWWWEKDALTDATYVSGRSARKITGGTATVKNGRGSWTFEVKYPEWGRYLVVASDASGGREGGHSAAQVVYIDWPGWAGRGQEGGTGSAAMLPLTSDKERYAAGETAVLSFQSGAKGRALVTVEKNGEILSQSWLETVKGTTLYRLPLTPAMAPNAYVHVTLLQPHLQTANSLPIRLYGVVPIPVENPATRLAPAIEAPASWEPGKKAAFTVTEASGREMTYTVAVVDEGLLGLTRFSAPDPREEFYKKEASQLESWDIYRYVMSAYGGKLETLLSIGGSEGILGGGNKKAERFKPVVRFFGPYRLEAGGRGATEFEMPNYVGAVRVMVVAGREGAYGVAEKKVAVKSDLMVLKTLPRTLGANEAVDVPVTVFNGGTAPLPVEVSLSASGAVEGSWSKTVTVAPLSDETVSFRAQTTLPGTAVFTAGASAGGKRVLDESTGIEILSRGSPVTTVRDFTVTPGKTWRAFVPSPGEKGSKSITAELSTLPVLDLDTRLRYLIGYPHGCIEQITSRAFPQLYIPSMIQLAGDDVERVKDHVRSVIDRYPSYQTAEGGFAYWSGGTEESEWGTNYAGHFMIEAKRAGYEVPDILFKGWLSREQDLAKNWQSASDKYRYENQAYRLYVLALAGYPDIGSMNRLAAVSGLEGASSWMLAAAYALAGHRGTADGIAANLDPWAETYRDTGYNFGSDLRDAAVALRCLADLADRQRAAELVPKVAERFADGRWYSTQETAWMVMALAPWYAKSDGTPTTYAVEWDRGTREGSLTRGTAVENLEAFESPTQTVVVKNTGTKTLYGRVTTRGRLSAGQEREVADGIAMTVTYLDPAGMSMPLSSVALGDSFSVRVAVQNQTRSKIENIALTVPVPTAWEFGNSRVGAFDEEETGEAQGSDSSYDWRDFRDTGINTYFSLERNETKTFTFHATAAYSADYYVGAVRAEAMYDASIQAVVPGSFIEGSGR